MVLSGFISAPVYVIYLIVGVWFLFQALLELPLVLCTRHKAYQSVSLYIEGIGKGMLLQRLDCGVNASSHMH